MKTTIDLPDDLLGRGKATARLENSTLKALIEEGPRMALRARSCKRSAPFAAQPFAVDTNILVYAHRTDSPFHQ